MRLMLLAVLAGLFTGGVAEAAPLRGQGFGGGQQFMGGRGPAMGAAPFNVDPSPCGAETRQRGESGRYDCRQPSRQPRGNNGSRRPGSNAFGLQFDPYGD